MMGLYKLKFWYRKVIEPLARYKINPDILAYAAVIVSLITPAAYYYSIDNPLLLVAAMVLILLRMTLNTLDGVIAIRYKLVSKKGDIVNAFPDRYSDIFLFMGISFSPLVITELGLVCTTFILLVSYSGMLGKAIGVSWQNNGPLGKVDRLIALHIFTFLQFIALIFGFETLTILSIDLSVLDLFFAWCLLASQITIFNRIRASLREIR